MPIKERGVEYLRIVTALHQVDWDARLPIFLLAYDTAGLTPTNLIFRR
jgi:hypothetical protein